MFFDSINYEILNNELDNLGFDESSKNLIRNFLTNRRQSLILQDCISDEITLLRGVPQGTELNPLFKICILKILQHELTKKLNLYNMLTILFFFLTFGTSIDESKAKLKQNANKLIQYFHEQHLTVDEKPEVKYLGVHIDSTLTFQGGS